MALVTVQRSPSPSGSDESDEHEVCDGTEESNIRSPRQRRRRRSKSALKKLRKLFNTVRFVTKLKPCFSESYFTVKGAALILPQSDYETAFARKVTKSHGGDIQSHLQAMFSLLRPHDTIKVAVRLESSHTKYLVVVSCVGKQDTEESVILGIDISDKAAIGLVMPVWAHAHIQLDGDGGFSIQLDNNKHVFKPVSVQAMWSALQSLNKVLKVSTENLYIPRGLTHTWTGYYESKLDTDSPFFSEWNTSEDIDRSYRHSDNPYEDTDDDSLYRRIKTELKLVMMKVDLEEVTCLYIRKEVETVLGVDLKEHRSFFDKEMFAIMGQMDAPSMILEHLYLGSEWNASNLEELQINGVNYILNISREIDNFFPGILHYMNVREWDVEGSNLIKYWEDTYKFIDKARSNGSKTLVHCKMGISRSASTVIAYLMKENKWSLQQAFEFTKGKRSIINPNAGFWKQLELYEGILNASGHRPKFEKKNIEGLLTSPKEEDEDEEDMDGLSYLNPEDFLALKLGPEASGLGELAFIPEPDTRSADSTEESYPDKPSPNMMKPGRHPRHHHHPVHKKQRQLSPTADADKEKPESGDYLSSDDSECTDSENMTDSSDDEGGDSEDKAKKFKPIDIPVLNIAEEGSPGRVKKPIKVGVQRSKSDGDKHLLNVDSLNPSFSRESSLSRYRPDGSWIKLEPDESDKSEGETGNLKESDADSCADRLDDKKAEDIGLWINNLVDGEPEDMEVNDDTVDEKKEDSPEPAQEKEDTCTDVGGIADEGKSVDKGDDKSATVLDPYVKENIPWNPGTVRKQKQDLEEKFASSQGGSKKQDSIEGDESVKQDFPQDADKKMDSVEISDSLQKVDEKKDEESEREVVGEEIQTSPSATSSEPSVPVDGGEKRELTSCDSPNKSEEVEKTSDEKILASDEKILQSDEELSVQAEDDVDPALKTSGNRKSVYELEEIDLPEGIVKKTTMEIEERNKSTDETPKIKVQRSSSLKSKRVTPKSKDRDSERRKTCIALLSPTHTDYTQRESSQQDKESDSASSSSHVTGSDQGQADADEGAMECQASSDKEEENMTASVKVYKYMGEELTVQEGLVRKQTMDIEQKSGETTQRRSSPTSSCSIESPSADLLPATVMEQNTSVSPVAVPPNESIDETSIHKVQNIKCLYDSVAASAEMNPGKGSTPHSLHTSPVAKKGGRFDSETLELIREIGSALLNSPAKVHIDTESDDVIEGESLVSHYVRNIESREKYKKGKFTREIIIVDKDGTSTASCDSTKLASSASAFTSPVKSSQPEIKSSNSDYVAVARKQTLSPASSMESDDKSLKCSKWSQVSSQTPALQDSQMPRGASADDEHSKNAVSKKDIQPCDSCIGSDYTSQHELTPDSPTDEQECTSVKNLVGRFSQPSSEKALIYGMPSTPTALTPPNIIPDSNINVEVVEAKDSSRGTGATSPPAACAESPHRVLRHRHSEPVIHLCGTSMSQFDKKLREMGSSLFEAENETDDGVIPDKANQATAARPKSAELSPRHSRTFGQKHDELAKSSKPRPKKSLSESEPHNEFPWEGKRVRKTYGRSHPLAKYENKKYMESLRNNPFYSTM